MKTRVALLAALVWWASCSNTSAQIMVFSVPSGVSFSVTNVGQSTAGNPSATRVSFLGVSLALFHVLRVSVRADSDFVPPSGSSIPASNVSWTTSNASGVVGTSGTLNTTSFSQVFQSPSNIVSAGGIDIHWTLAAPGAGIRAGSHTAVVRWRVEAVIP